jgi:protein TonB
MRYNTAHTFSGKLPPMLPAVVVLRITVDDTGRMTDVWVQRAPEDDIDAARIAVASMHRAGVLPRPFNLATGPERSLSYSETFLFNDDYRFQIRTLAPIQTED